MSTSSDTTTWKLDDPGVMYGSGDSGGDRQVSSEWSVRFVGTPWTSDNGRTMYPFLTTTYYVVRADGEDFDPETDDPDKDDDAEPGSCRYAVERQTQFLITTDPDSLGSGEVWSDYEYDDGSAFNYDTIRGALNEAKFAAEGDAASPDYIGWNGRPTR